MKIVSNIVDIKEARTIERLENIIIKQQAIIDYLLMATNSLPLVDAQIKEGD